LRPYQYVTVTAQGFAPGETVYVHVVSNNNSPYGDLICDATGTCSGQLSFYGIGLTYGSHLLDARGDSSGLQAQTSFFLVAGIHIDPSQGGVGTAIQVFGDAFNPNETVGIYWGDPSPATFIGNAVADAQGLVGFANKTNGDPFVATGKPGLYQIVVVRQQHKPVQRLSVMFHLLAPKIQVPATLVFGQSFTTTILGFGANELVDFHWNANGGQDLGTIQTGSDGSGITTFWIPSAPAGSYKFTATGETSGITATRVVHTGPGLEAAITGYTFPGQTITLNGGGFTPGATIQLYFQSTQNGVVTTNADSTGAFTLPFTLPDTYDPQNTSYAIYAVNTAKGAQKASTPIAFTPPDISHGIPGDDFGLSTQVQGDNFAVGETVDIFWNYGQTDQQQIASVTVDQNGQFAALTIALPSEPAGTAITVAAVGQTSHLVVTQTFTPVSELLFPSKVAGGVSTLLQGGNFGQNETVSIDLQWLDGSELASYTAQTDTSGIFSLNIVIPLLPKTIGSQVTIVTTGQTSGVRTITYVNETPTVQLTPTTGSDGTSLTLTGQGFLSASSVPIIWFNPTPYTVTNLATATTDANGQFSQALTAPTGLVSGQTYYVEALASNGQYIDAAFTAQ